MKKYCICLALLLAVLVPHTASAFTGEGSVKRLSNNVFVYSETITLTANTDTVTVPIEAFPQMRPRTDSSSLKYRTLLDGEAWAGLETYAAVISETSIEGDRYTLSNGESADFTFVAVLVLPDTETIRPTLMVDFEITSFPVIEQ